MVKTVKQKQKQIFGMSYNWLRQLNKILENQIQLSNTKIQKDYKSNKFKVLKKSQREIVNKFSFTEIILGPLELTIL